MVPVWELRNNNSKLYPSFAIVSHSMKCGFGEPGKVGILPETVSV